MTYDNTLSSKIAMHAAADRIMHSISLDYIKMQAAEMQCMYVQRRCTETGTAENDWRTG